MIYLFEAELPDNMSIFFALNRIYGLGKTRSFLICKKLGFSINLKIKHLSKEQINEILNIIEDLNFILASDLKKFKALVTKNLIEIKSYRGLRKYQGLPVRGQRTHTNAKTARKKFL
jgi:small subunit ribosomal protein S13